MSRRNLSTLSSEEKTEFYNLLVKYINSDEDPASEHEAGFSNHHGTHFFLAWHRYFIAKLEAWLVGKGANQYVPIPFWNPAYPIPKEFSHPKAGRISEDINKPLPGRFTVFGDGELSLQNFENYADLNHDIQHKYHDGIHGDIGGVMMSARSPEDPIFWSLHAMFDLIWEQWRSIR